MQVDKRQFLKASATALGAAMLPGCALTELWYKDHWRGKAGIARRTLGRTGRKVSIIGLGGMVLAGRTPEDAAKAVAENIESGVNYFDVAPTYGDSELKLGPALRPYRKDVFLASKTTRRDREGAREELRNSLKRLQTERLDLYQLHAITDVEKDVKAALGKGGAIEAFLEARRQGRIQHIGFTAHSPQAALAAMGEFDFDTIMYPINFVCHFDSGFEVAVLAEAKKQNLGIICIKALAKQKWQPGADRSAYSKCWYEPIAEPELARLALSWSLAQGSATILPPGDEKLYGLVLELAVKCPPPTEDGLAHLRDVAFGLDPLFRK
jgi:aryl-alcohol dehydrogenase-like predicted oxidoreductase